jgi:hypothetical protein
MRAISLATLVALMSGCGDAPREPLAVVPGPPLEEAAPAAIDVRDQYAMALAMLQAETLDPDAQPSAFVRVREAWEGRRYRWTMGRIEALCGEGPCLLVPFDHARFPHHVYYAFLARAALRDGQREAIESACAPHRDAGCVITIEGTLARLGLTLDAPASLALDDVVLIEARAASETEHWGSHPRGQSAGPPLTGLMRSPDEAGSASD